ncbi:TRAP transporter substrate-binding protein (plasmid) [Sinorhizobium meliloti WSM1022]|jgi:TRAP-type C4-dicarboxylate transport system substrate-binding protein|uniref:TRAP-type periplasmic solute-binding protein n=4 Tax=Rhizobium meliloti TaxID=382 RepID=Q92WM6_RHIME|nr:TRAP transporter substrate-binding protein [Sinorhizobium meliloti]TWB05894.1 TRAP-type C4-dicarboxylate transport system substrate-binding protein [Ensifer sp. SEMIA 134]TWB40361.1 TRAP-type C4-dicarboxylate transport system substrate-binding protein [Ensifer sp. SEMIA 135]AEH84128.1 TRAP-type periplasmic solute-binding protein [Sinorhizobium meliloti SM11]AGA11386.1 TRAP-type C4-dicarboxylate transport system, periplasmic component [Sinorhizobium meliloti GR4]AGG71306.1 Trap-type periplas
MTFSRRTFLGGVAAGAALSLATPSLVRAQETRTLRLGIVTPPGHPWNNAALKVGEALKAETNGRLSISVFPAGQLGNEAAMLQQMQSGALDLGWIMTAELGSRIPAVAAINAPWVVDSTAKVAKLVREPVAMKLLDVLPAETGTVGLAWGITTMRVVFSAKEIAGLDDINGMKLRINTTPAYRDFYQLLGAAPTPIPTPAVFDAMSNGQVDGLEADLDFSWNQRFDKVSKTMLKMNAIFMPCVALASGRVWQTLPEADREIIARLTKSALDEQIDATVANEPALLEKFAGAGIPIKDVTVADAGRIIAEYDKIWLPKAPVLAELRKVGATL